MGCRVWLSCPDYDSRRSDEWAEFKVKLPKYNAGATIARDAEGVRYGPRVGPSGRRTVVVTINWHCSHGLPVRCTGGKKKTCPPLGAGMFSTRCYFGPLKRTL